MSRVMEAPQGWLQGDPITVWVIGAGGNGGEVADALAQFHTALLALGAPGLAVAIMDDAVVRDVNLVRQRFWQGDVGQNKAVTLAHRYNCLLGTSWQGIPMRLEEALERFQPRQAPKVIISAVDLASARRFIANGLCPDNEPFGTGHFSRMQLLDTLWLDLGNRARSGQAVLGRLTDDDAFPNVLAHYPRTSRHGG